LATIYCVELLAFLNRARNLGENGTKALTTGATTTGAATTGAATTGAATTGTKALTATGAIMTALLCMLIKAIIEKIVKNSL